MPSKNEFCLRNDFYRSKSFYKFLYWPIFVRKINVTYGLTRARSHREDRCAVPVCDIADPLFFHYYSLWYRTLKRECAILHTWTAHGLKISLLHMDSIKKLYLLWRDFLEHILKPPSRLKFIYLGGWKVWLDAFLVSRYQNSLPL